jgi:hypothetical protein
MEETKEENHSVNSIPNTFEEYSAALKVDLDALVQILLTTD